MTIVANAPTYEIQEIAQFGMGFFIRFSGCRIQHGKLIILCDQPDRITVKGLLLHTGNVLKSNAYTFSMNHIDHAIDWTDMDTLSELINFLYLTSFRKETNSNTFF